MDRVFSARIDDAVYKKITDLSKKMHTSKKAVIENAIKLLGEQLEQDNKTDIFIETSGIWKRKELPGETVSKVKTTFRNSMHRYQ